MGLTSNELIQLENRSQAATQVSISNSINSLRFLNTTNWRDFVEDTSIVEATLQRDISGIYGKMDFYTRDQYRHAVEKIAKCSNLSEQAVAEMAIKAAREGSSVNNDPGGRRSHVGYYLTGKGYIATSKAAKARTTAFEKCRRITNQYPLLIYLGGICILSFLICWLLIAEASTELIRDPILVTICIIALMATTKLSLSLVNWLITILAKPSILPRMDYSKGIPGEAKSMVVIPALITDISLIDRLVEGLEVRFLANRDVNLYFALLTDFKDAPTEHLPEDESLLLALKNRIIELNKKYQRPSNDLSLIHI